MRVMILIIPSNANNSIVIRLIRNLKEKSKINPYTEPVVEIFYTFFPP